MNIPTSQARALFTDTLIAVYRDRIAPTNFLRSFFPTVESVSKLVSIEVQRMGEQVAVDVVRGTDGNRNKFSKSTQKTFEPAYYREWFDMTDIDLYDRLNSPQVEDVVYAEFISNVADKLMSLQELIERSYELQCSQVLETGVVKLVAGTDIDFKRKAESIVDPGAYWATNGVSPFEQLEAACTFIRSAGKAGGNVFLALCGSTALNDLLKNDIVNKRQSWLNKGLDAVQTPQMLLGTGATYHGTLTCGSYLVQLWAYPQFYDHPETGVQTPYINPKKVIVIPQQPKFKLAFAAVPQIVEPGAPVAKGAYRFGELIDKYNGVHKMDIKSAGIAVPVAVDQIYTLGPVAGAFA